MTEQTEYLDVGSDKILDLDADAQGGFIAFVDSKTVITDDNRLTVDIDVRFPIIRRLKNDTFLIVDSRTDSSPNGHIYNFAGQKVNSFLVGDGVEDIVVHHGKIIATYFDEGVLGADGPNNDGVAVFDFEGNQLFGFNSSAVWGHILDCYCICKHGTNRVLFYAYTELKVYELNLDTMKAEVYDTPNDFSGTTAISSKGDKTILHSTYHDKESFFMWDRIKNEVKVIGSYTSKLKGIKNGKFLAFGDKGYTIVDPME
jgi:hypothetical protein